MTANRGRSTGGQHLRRGLSVVELMVGIAIGMFIVGGAIKLFVDMFGNNRRLLLEARVNQDLRAAADIVARDLRRGGYWRNSLTGVTAVGASAPATNPHAAMTLAANSVQYSYDRDGDAAVSNTTEEQGFRLNGNVIETRVGAGWQQLTDPSTVQITAFSVSNAASAVQWFDLAQHCDCIARGTCTLAGILAAPAGAASRPQVGARWVDIQIEGRAANDSRVTRRIVESVRVRNDQVRGACPP